MSLPERTIRLGLYSTLTVEAGKPYEPYAWPGGYPIVYYTHDGETLCADCATQEELDPPDIVIGAMAWNGRHFEIMRNPSGAIWGCDALEGSAIDHGIVTCDNCNKVLVDIDIDCEWQCNECGQVNDNDTVCACGHSKVGE